MLNAPKSIKKLKMNVTVSGELKARMDALLSFQKEQGHPLKLDDAIESMLGQMLDTLPELADFREAERSEQP